MAEQSRLDIGRMRHVAAVAEEAVANGTLPTAVVAVANRSETLWTHVVAGADGVSLDTIFLLASISKPILATGFMQMVEQGRLSLHKPISTYAPEFGAYGKQGVNAWHLLTHTSGMDEAKWGQALVEQKTTCGACFEEACATHLHYAPGTQYEYCTLSFAALAEMMERRGGAPYREYMRQNVFAPLGMDATGFEPVDTGRAAPVAGFATPDHLARFTAKGIAGGGVWSTAADLVALGQAYLNDGAGNGQRILAPATIDLITSNQTEGINVIAEGRPWPVSYGLGWSKPQTGRGALCSARAYSHGGATGTLLHVDPEWNLVVVLLTNLWGGDQDVAVRMVSATYGALTRD